MAEGPRDGERRPEEEPEHREPAPAAGDDAPAPDEAPPRPEEAPPGPDEAPAAPPESAAEEEAPAPAERRRGGDRERGDEVIPGAHLEPDLVLEEEREAREGEVAEYAGAEVVEEAPPTSTAAAEPEAPVAEEEAPAEEPKPVAREPLDLAADARYLATGKRKSAVARVVLRPGDGAYRVNGRHLDEFFPRIKLQRMARQPLEVAGYAGRMDVIARIHGGGVASQAGALRHGIARALVEADPQLRLELKRRGYLTRDPRRKERKKAGLKKARKRPQFSKR